MTEINWKDNLRIAWFGNFLTGAKYFFGCTFYAHLRGKSRCRE